MSIISSAVFLLLMSNLREIVSVRNKRSEKKMNSSFKRQWLMTKAFCKESNFNPFDAHLSCRIKYDVCLNPDMTNIEEIKKTRTERHVKVLKPSHKQI